MRLYHGSSVEIPYPNIDFSRKKLDFGQGFYLTPIKQQAINWAMRFKRLGKSAIVNHYELDEKVFDQYRTLTFDCYNEQWLDFILANRMEKKVEAYDVIIGGVANDRVFNTIELFLENLIGKQEALGRLIYEENNSQYCIRSQQLIEKHLQFIESEIL